MSVHVHIDRLIVDAGMAGDPAALEAGVIAALRETMGGPRPGWWAGDATLPVVRAVLPPGVDAGARIGAAIHASLTSAPESAR